jgi:endonuclease YncB( thermonuclease family)
MSYDEIFGLMVWLTVLSALGLLIWIVIRVVRNCLRILKQTLEDLEREWRPTAKRIQEGLAEGAWRATAKRVQERRAEGVREHQRQAALMQRAHPDVGGSNFFAKQLNDAPDLLLRKMKTKDKVLVGWAIAIGFVAVVLAFSTRHDANDKWVDWQEPAPTISGSARVIDGDTVVVAGTTVRLKGVDAAELGTARGEDARRVMDRLVNGRLTCRLTGEKTHGREVGYCATADGTDINLAIIAQGAALACPRYDDRYVPFEQAAALAAQPRSSYCVKRF